MACNQRSALDRRSTYRKCLDLAPIDTTGSSRFSSRAPLHASWLRRRSAAQDPVRKTIAGAVRARHHRRGAAVRLPVDLLRRTQDAAIPVGHSPRRADVRHRQRPTARQAAAPDRPARADVPDPPAQPRLVGQGRAARVRRPPAARRQPRDLPVLPRPGPAAPSAGELRKAQRLLAGEARLPICARWRTTSSSLASSATGSSPGSTTSPTAGARRRGSRGWRREPRCRRWPAPATA